MTTTTTTQTITANDLRSDRDKYGRTCYQHYSIRGVVCVIPKRTRHLVGHTAFVNLHDGQPVQEFQTTREAKAFLAANGARR